MVRHHSNHSQVFNYELVVGLDQLVGYLMQKMAPDVRDPTVVAGETANGFEAIA